MNIRTINNRTSRLCIQLGNMCTSYKYINSTSVMRKFFTLDKTKLLTATATVVTTAIGSSTYFSGRSYCAGIAEEEKLVVPQIFQYKICPFCSRGSNDYL